MMFLTFYGNFRGTKDQQSHLHESPKSMTIPLIILAILSSLGGFIGVPEVLGGSHWLAGFLAPVFAGSAAVTDSLALTHSTEYILMAVSVTAALAAAVFAYFRYVKKSHVPVSDSAKRNAFANLSYHKFYVDELYQALFTRPLDALSGFFYRVVDKAGIDGFVNGLGSGTTEASKGIRLLQSGNTGFYIFMMVGGIVALFIYGFYRI